MLQAAAGANKQKAEAARKAFKYFSDATEALTELEDRGEAYEVKEAEYDVRAGKVVAPAGRAVTEWTAARMNDAETCLERCIASLDSIMTETFSGDGEESGP